MTLKGNWASNKAYDIGDIVKYTDGGFYHLQKPAAAGTPPTETRYWGRISQSTEEAAGLAMDAAGAVNVPALANNLTTTASGKALDARQGKALKELIDALDLRVTALEPTPDPEETTGTTEGT